MNKTNVPTPHNSAKVGDIAKTVLMPGDPLRAKFIAEKFLENVVCFNQVRGMLGFTGTYKGKKVSVMGSGMGMPSIGIYSFELYKFYEVENIIRIGSCGAYDPSLKVLDIVLVEKAYSESTFLKVMQNRDDEFLTPTPSVNKKIEDKATELGLKITKGNITSSDCFYNMQESYYLKEKEKTGAIAVEMESFALFANAQALNKNAACILTVSDNIATQEEISAESREKAFTSMMELALGAGIEL